MAAGAVPLLVALLESDQQALQSSAAGAFRVLGRDFGSHQNRAAIVATGVMPLLAALAVSNDQMCRRQHRRLWKILQTTLNLHLHLNCLKTA